MSRQIHPSSWIVGLQPLDSGSDRYVFEFMGRRARSKEFRMATQPTMPKADPRTAAFFRTIIPNDPRVSIRPMFGHTAAFVNGQMFAGTFGSHVFARLGETSRAELLAVPGATAFAPMKNRPMKEYVQLPSEMLSDAPAAKQWIARALEWTSTLPPKAKRAKRTASRAKPTRTKRAK
jgi:TfoX/Sxy family transcriptional regulator of competence genes